jgi:hypothetical protein
MELDGYEACKLFMALKFHFTTDKYDFHKYNGNVRLDQDTFRVRKDRWVCNRLAKTYNTREGFINFASTVFAHSDMPKKLITNDLLHPKAVNAFDKSNLFVNNFDIVFDNEMENTFGHLVDIGMGIVPINGEEPPIFTYHKQEPDKFSLESLTVFNRIVNFIGMNDHLVTDDLIYPITRNKVLKYELFLVSRIDNYYDRAKGIIKKKVTRFLDK